MERVARQLPERRIEGKGSGPRHFLATAGVDAGALGVATLPIYSIFAPEHTILLKQRREQGSIERGLPRSIASR
jgi:hypothetical protein